MIPAPLGPHPRLAQVTVLPETRGNAGGGATVLRACPEHSTHTPWVQECPLAGQQSEGGRRGRALWSRPAANVEVAWLGLGQRAGPSDHVSSLSILDQTAVIESWGRLCVACGEDTVPRTSVCPQLSVFEKHTTFWSNINPCAW